jgi:hypothetical protein
MGRKQAGGTKANSEGPRGPSLSVQGTTVSSFESCKRIQVLKTFSKDSLKNPLEVDRAHKFLLEFANHHLTPNRN